MLHSPRPDKAAFAAFLASARQRYEQVYFIGAGGTDLLGPGVAAERVVSERFEVPEYEATPHDVYPRASRMKPFAFTIYRFVDPPAGPGTFSTDVGRRGRSAGRAVPRQGTHERRRGDVSMDAGRLVLLHSRHRCGQPRDRASVEQRRAPLTADTGARDRVPRQSRAWIGRAGGRASKTTRSRSPRSSPPRSRPRRTASEVRLNSSIWIPREVLGGTDSRQLGVMVDRAEVR